MQLRKPAAALLIGLAAWSARAGDLVVIVHPGAPALTKEQVADVFLGRAPRSLPLDQLHDAPIRSQFYRRATDRDLAQVRSVWSRVIFTGKARMPKEYADSAAVKKAVAENPRAVGYIEKSAVDGSVSVAYEFD
jgi:ABC-type phosphate transport system substrate-binding protein